MFCNILRIKMKLSWKYSFFTSANYPYFNCIELNKNLNREVKVFAIFII